MDSFKFAIFQTGVLASYAINVGEAEEERYNTTLQIYTPLENLPQLLVRATHETETNIYRTNLSVTTNSSDISVTTKAEVNM